MSDWNDRILTEDAKIRDLLAATRRIAVLGIKTEAQADQPAFYVPKFLVDHGLDVVPVPVYFPEAKQDPRPSRLPQGGGRARTGRPRGRVPPPPDVAQHVQDLLAKKPRAVWLQLGVRDDAAAEALARAGILVVQDRCLMVEWRRLGPG